ncbi:MAG: hypothetical protein AB1427_15595 [Thermodesulfobacteriota bacterium]
MKQLCLLVLVVMISPFLSIDHSSAMTAVSLELDRENILEAPAEKLDRGGAPKLLYSQYRADYSPYIKVYRFRVEPGSKYTFYMFHPADGVYLNAYLRGDNPLSDYTYSYGPGGFLRGFVSWGQQPGKESCEYQVRRYNFTIAPESQQPWLYLVATYAKPGTQFKVLLKSRADDDEDVSGNTASPYCPKRKGHTWGQVWKQKFLLTKIPEK